MDAASLCLLLAAVFCCVSAKAQWGPLDELPDYHIEHARALKRTNSTTVKSVDSRAGVMQLQVEGYFNKYGRDAKGRCCMLATNSSASVTSCPAECRTFFRVCAARVGPNWPEEPDLRQHTLACPLGLLVTPTLARNSLDPHREGVLLMRFPYKEWPGKLKLTLEAWHDVSGDLFSRGTQEMTRQDYPEENVARLILRVERRHRLAMGDDWMRRSVHLSVPRGETPSSRKPGRRISITYALRLVSPSESTTTTTTTPVPEPVHVPLPVISGYGKVNTTSRPRPKPKPTVSSEPLVPYPSINPTPETIPEPEPEPVVQAEQVPLVAYPSKNPTSDTTSAPKPEPVVQAEQVPLVAYPSKNPTFDTTSAPKPEPLVQAEQVPLVAYPSKNPASNTISTSTTTVKNEPLSEHIPLVPYPSSIPTSDTSVVPQPKPEPTAQSEHVPLVPYPSNNRPSGTTVPQPEPVIQSEQVHLVPYPSKIPTSPVKTEHVPVVPYPSQNPTPDTKITSTTTSEPEYQYQYIPYPLYGKSNLTADSMKPSTTKPKPESTTAQTNIPENIVKTSTTTESSRIQTNPTSDTMLSSNDVTTVVDMTRNLTETTSMEPVTTEVVEATTQQQTETTLQEVEVATTTSPMVDDDEEFEEDTWEESDVEPPMIENLSLADLISDILMQNDTTLHISDSNMTEVSSTPATEQQEIQTQETVQDQKPKRRLTNVRTKSRLLW